MLLPAIGLLLLLPGASNVDAVTSQAPAPARAPRDFDLQAHRGGRGLWPENTLASFAGALSLGVSTLELDCGVTKDGVVVISHDPLLNPDITRDASGNFLSTHGPSSIR